MQAERGAARPAFYALAPGGWRDYVSLLHPPYTAWHLSYVAIGAAVSGSLDAGRLVAALVAFALAVGIAAHALDELHDRPLQTRVPAGVLRLLAVASLAGAAAIGVAGVAAVGWSFLPWVVLGVALVLAYNLEWGGNAVHNDLGFALAWGAFPVLASAAAQGGVGLAVAGAAAFATLTSLAQRTLSNEVRGVRRRSLSVQGEIAWRDGTRTPLDAAALTRPEEQALLLLAAAHVVLAVVLVGLATWGRATSSPALACAYVLTLDEPHRTRASVSAAMLRDHDPDLHVTLLVPGRPDRAQWAAASRLLALADDVRLVTPLHEASGYFQDNRAHLAAVDADRIVYLDADTLVFGSVQALAARFAAADVAARPSPWVWQRGYRHGLAPDIVAPLNGGVLCLSRAFCARWTAGAVARHASFLHDPGRRELAAWLRSVTPHAYHRDEFVLSELAWSTPWRAQTMQATDCHLLERWPSQEDPETWLRATILHTYSSEWEACVERLRAVVDVPYARRSPARPKEVLVATTSELTPADRSALDRRFDQRWVDWVVAHLLGRADRAAIVDVMVRRDFPREYAETRVAAIADSPILVAAARAHRPAAKAASFLEVLAELHRRSGFTLERRRLSPDAFYREHVFPNLPVILPGLMDGWPAMTEWRPERLKERFGHAVVEVTRGRESDARYEDNFRAHRSSMSFGAYVDLVEQSGASNDHYLVARNDVLYQTDLAGLRDDFDVPQGYLDPAGTARRYVRLWYGPAGTVTPLHCDNRNVLFAQVRGWKQVHLVAPQFLKALANDRACYTAIDLDDVDLERYPAMRSVPVLTTVVEPGELLFIPVGWWHAVRSLDVSMSLSFTNFCFNEPEIGWREATL